MRGGGESVVGVNQWVGVLNLFIDDVAVRISLNSENSS